MKPLPKTKSSLVLRSHFASDSAWSELCAAIQEPVGEFRAYVTFLSDPAYDGATIEQIMRLASPNDRSFLFIADRIALENREHPLLVVDLVDEQGGSFAWFQRTRGASKTTCRWRTWIFVSSPTPSMRVAFFEVSPTNEVHGRPRTTRSDVHRRSSRGASGVLRCSHPRTAR